MKPVNISLFSLLIMVTLIIMNCQGPSEIRLLVVTGGHDFDKESFYAMLDGFDAMSYEKAVQPHANELYASDSINTFDVLVFYDMFQHISEAQQSAFINVLEQGKGAVFLHHALASYQDWEEYEQIIGGRYILEADSADNDASTYQHDVDISVSVMDTIHPVTRGVDDFVLHDEVYGGFRVLDRVHPLLFTHQPQSGEIIGWCHTYRNSRIVYLQPGHDQHAYENPNYQRLLRQAIEWVNDTGFGNPTHPGSS